MDNNQLAYVQRSKFGTFQIRWLSELALFNFAIKYKVGKSNKANETFHEYPINSDSLLESDMDIEGAEVISYSSVCEIVNWNLGTTKLTSYLMAEAQSISSTV